MKIEIAPNLKLPLEVVTETIAIIAKRRMGKSYRARKLSEELFEAGQQVVVVDPKGDWWGLRFAADGKHPGLPIIILGGEHGDVPLESSGGELVAKLVVEERVSALLDLSSFRKHEVATFMTAFLENLYRLKNHEAYRTPMMLIIDEADAIAPQRPHHGEERMLGAAEDIVRRGGQRGIGCTLVTQRSAVINKNVLTQTQMLIALRTIARQDREALEAWIEVHGTEEQQAVLMESIASLPEGEAWAWSPGWPDDKGIFKRITRTQIKTFNSGATPKPGEKTIVPKNAADVDLEALRRQMADTVERAKERDPKLLRAENVKLRAELAKAQAAAAKPSRAPGGDATPKPPKRVEVEVVKDGQIKRLEAMAEKLLLVATETGMLAKEVLAPVRALASRPPAPQQLRPNPAQTLRATAPAIRSRPSRSSTSETDGALPVGERAVLEALIQFPDGLRREQLTILTTYKRSTRNAYVDRLTKRGYATIDGERVLATEAGRASLPDAQPLPTGSELREHWRTRLPAGEWAVLDVLITAYPETITREEIDRVTGFKRSTRNAYISRLIAKEIVVDVGYGQVRAHAMLFDK